MGWLVVVGKPTCCHEGCCSQGRSFFISKVALHRNWNLFNSYFINQTHVKDKVRGP